MKKGDREEVSFLYSRVSLPKKSQWLKPLVAISALKSWDLYSSLLALRALNYTGLILIPKGHFINTELVIKEDQLSKQKEKIFTNCEMWGVYQWAGCWVEERRDPDRSVWRSGVHSHRAISRIMINLWETVKGVTQALVPLPLSSVTFLQPPPSSCSVFSFLSLHLLTCFQMGKRCQVGSCMQRSEFQKIYFELFMPQGLPWLQEAESSKTTYFQRLLPSSD